MSEYLGGLEGLLGAAGLSSCLQVPQARKAQRQGPKTQFMDSFGKSDSNSQRQLNDEHELGMQAKEAHVVILDLVRVPLFLYLVCLHVWCKLT